MIKKVELEITSDCNAACPGCARTIHSEKVEIKSFKLDDIIKLFPDKSNIENVQFKFCGVLGDPAMNLDCVDMIDYLSSNGGYCEVSTNGGVQRPEWWARLGQIASANPGLVHIHFCLDGHKETNHIYRVNTKFSIIERNMQAFADNAPDYHATWIYIIFDHNEHELDTAKEHAQKLGFRFATRTGMRNSYNSWIATLKKKQEQHLVEKKYVITTSGTKEHSKKEQVAQLENFIRKAKFEEVDKAQVDEIVNSIVCKYIHEGEIFIANNLTMWPCCFLWDSAFKNSENIIEKLEIFEPNWNSLKHHSIAEIQQHPWFQEMLTARWDPSHKLPFSRCIRSCAKNKAYHNEINYTDN